MAFIGGARTDLEGSCCRHDLHLCTALDAGRSFTAGRQRRLQPATAMQPGLECIQRGAPLPTLRGARGDRHLYVRLLRMLGASILIVLLSLLLVFMVVLVQCCAKTVLSIMTFEMLLVMLQPGLVLLMVLSHDVSCRSRMWLPSFWIYLRNSLQGKPCQRSKAVQCELSFCSPGTVSGQQHNSTLCFE